MKLTIAEGLYLIALDDEEGRLLSAAEKKHRRGNFSRHYCWNLTCLKKLN